MAVIERRTVCQLFGEFSPLVNDDLSIEKCPIILQLEVCMRLYTCRRMCETHDEFCIKNEEFCITNDGFCI